MRSKTLNPHAGSFVPGVNGAPVAATAATGGGSWGNDNTNNNAVAAAAAGLMAMFPPIQPANQVNMLPPRTTNLGGNPPVHQQQQQPFTASSTVIFNPSATGANNSQQQQQSQLPSLNSSAVHRALMQVRLAVVNRCSLSSMPFPNAHLYFEHLMYTAYKTACANGATSITGNQSGGGVPLKPFWRFFSVDQVASLAYALVSAERSSSTAAQQSASTPTKGGAASSSLENSGMNHHHTPPRPSTAFSDEELDILKGIYYRNAHSVFPSPLRKQLISATASLLEAAADGDVHFPSPSTVYCGGITARGIDDAENFIVDVFWATFRTVFLPSPDECGLQALTAGVQFASQLRSHLFQSGACSQSVLGLLLPLMTLSRYYVVLQRGAAGGSGEAGPSSSILFSHYFMNLVSSFFTTSPFDAVETIHERLTGGSSSTWQPPQSQPNNTATPQNNGAMNHNSNSTTTTGNAANSDYVKEWTSLFSNITHEVSTQVRSILEAPPSSSSSVLPQVRWFPCSSSQSHQPSSLLELALGNYAITDHQGGLHAGYSQQRSSSVASANQQQPLVGGIPPSQTTTASPAVVAAPAGPQSHQQAHSGDPNGATGSSIDTSSDPSEEVQFPAPVLGSAFMDHVLQTSSWCSDDEMVRFATLTLANSDLISLSRLSQLFSGLRQAYNSETGGTFEALMDILAQYKTPTITANGHHNHTTAGGVPPGIQEVIEYLMFVIKPGNPTHVQALEDASELIDQRLEEQLAPRLSAAAAAAAAVVAQQHAAALASPPRLSGSAEFRGSPPAILALTSPQRGGLSLDDTAPLWQDDSIAEMSVGDDVVIRNASVSSAFKASGSIW